MTYIKWEHKLISIIKYVETWVWVGASESLLKSNIEITYFWVGAKMVSQFNMCMVYIWVGVYNILFMWNGDFINVVNESGTKYNLWSKLERQISMEMDVFLISIMSECLT